MGKTRSTKRSSKCGRFIRARTTTDQNDLLSVLHLLFTTELVEMIVLQSNFYATYKNIHISKPLTVDDFWLLLGVIIYMACVDLPGIEYYWKQGTRQQPVADAITRNRFRDIFRILHFNDSSLEPGAVIGIKRYNL